MPISGIFYNDNKKAAGLTAAFSSKHLVSVIETNQISFIFGAQEGTRTPTKLLAST